MDGWRPVARTLGNGNEGGGGGGGTDDEGIIRRAQLGEPLPNGWSLYPHQVEAVEHIVRRKRVILAFDMGLGKTLIALVAARAFQRERRCRVLVICPISVAAGWEKEAAAVGVVISIHSWGKVPEAEQELRKGQDFMLVCDEAHYMQNINAKRTKAALALADAASVLVLATGTPAKNAKPSNVFPLLVRVPSHRQPLYWGRQA